MYVCFPEIIIHLISLHGLPKFLVISIIASSPSKVVVNRKIYVFKSKETHVFILVYGNLCTFTVSEQIVFPDSRMIILKKTQKLIVTEYLYSQNKGFVYLHVLFNIGFALNFTFSDFLNPVA